jgi:hypothetical protein
MGTKEDHARLGTTIQVRALRLVVDIL